MLFNSWAFILLFLPITFAGTFWLGRYSTRSAALWLALASLAFYAAWDAPFVVLLLGSIVFNYSAGLLIARLRSSQPRRARIALIAAIVANLALLGYFKYANFFVASFTAVSGFHVPALDIVLPLGISFFTFTQIAFLVDVHRDTAREHDFVHYLLFVTYFPHLIAGPVLHHKQMMPQFASASTYRINGEHVAVGLTIFVLGLFKKVQLADNLAQYATPVFNAARDGQLPMLFEAWTGALAYTLQLYFDFSGYSDMAVGLSLMFNIRLPMNFDSPYKAVSIIDFWRRWHMTLSAFLRDYLYIALGGNRKGTVRRYFNLAATMVLGGLWHGAGWTFVIWGTLHGVYLMVNHAWRVVKLRMGWADGGRLSRIGAGTLTFIAVVIAWVFFRAENLSAAGAMLAGMSGMNGISMPGSPQTHINASKALPLIATALVLVWGFPNVRQWMQNYQPTWEDVAGKRPTQRTIGTRLVWRPTPVHALIVSGLFIWSANQLSRVSEFLYFQF